MALPSTRQGAFHLFSIVEIDVYLHWTWLIVAAIEIGYMRPENISLDWGLLLYLSLFLIVLLHEFGHALACRQVGGTADEIMLWPLGGLAYVRPPQRPGATLWSIAAGPLVNIFLLPPLTAAFVTARYLGWAHTRHEAYTFFFVILFMDVFLLAFNLLPVYPLDGGQILRSLLWFFLGRGRSLVAATVIGFAGAAGFVILALLWRSVWLIVIAGYVLITCWRGMKGAWALMRMERMPRRPRLACPACGSKPPVGAHWRCDHCRALFDPFESEGICPSCREDDSVAMCVDCFANSPLNAWRAGAETGIAAISGAREVAQ